MLGGWFYLYDGCKALNIKSRCCETFPTPAFNLIEITGTLNPCSSKEKSKSGHYKSFETPAMQT